MSGILFSLWALVVVSLVMALKQTAEEIHCQNDEILMFDTV